MNNQIKRIQCDACLKDLEYEILGNSLRIKEHICNEEDRRLELEAAYNRGYDEGYDNGYDKEEYNRGYEEGLNDR